MSERAEHMAPQLARANHAEALLREAIQAEPVDNGRDDGSDRISCR